MWDYGSLSNVQEEEYIVEKLRIINHCMSDSEISTLSELILSSQNKMREYAEDCLLKYSNNEEFSKQCARSSVSQRDIQRVFNFYQWLLQVFKVQSRYQKMSHNCALLLSLGLVYYMRLDAKHRELYKLFLDETAKQYRLFPDETHNLPFTSIFDNEIQWYIDKVILPKGIAKTTALKENVFAVLACTATRTPLIIVGDPGSSKTISVNIAIANMKGQESRCDVFRKTDVYRSLDPHFYQCSRRTTSVEIDKVFKRAISRQRSLSKVSLPVNCVVFMDEAGLPEQQLESLKVLHYHLDSREVSLVAVSNHVLDAAKSNRAVSLFRPRVQKKELQELAYECLEKKVTVNERKSVERCCDAYGELILDKEFRYMYGLRDFIHFVTYLRRHRGEISSIDDQLILKALERNFNGSERFNDICEIFFKAVSNV